MQPGPTTILQYVQKNGNTGAKFDRIDKNEAKGQDSTKLQPTKGKGFGYCPRPKKKNFPSLSLLDPP